MEQAKEAASAVTEFFAGNPFATPAGSRIEQATDDALASENWALNMEICDVINSTEEGPRDAIRAIKRRLQNQMGKSNTSVLYTLTVLETAVKNGGMRLHSMVCEKEFVQELVKLIGAKYDPPQVIQEKVLGLIQSWADAFQNVPELNGVVEVYNELKSKGVEFPMTDIDAMAPIITPKPTHSPVRQPPPPAAAVQQMQQMQYVQGGPVTPTPEQLAKLRSEFDVVQGNIRVLREMLSELVPGKEDKDDLDLLYELHKTCRAMQQRCIELLQCVNNEEVTNELLLVNDDFNNVFIKYDRYIKNRDGEKQDTKPPHEASAGAMGDAPLIDLGGSGEHVAIDKQVEALSMSDKNGTNEATSGSSYADNSTGLDQTSMGLGPAAQQKGNFEGNQPTKSELEAKEMETWLEGQTDSKGQAAGGTTKDFDEFLTERVQAASKDATTKEEEKMFGL